MKLQSLLFSFLLTVCCTAAFASAGGGTIRVVITPETTPDELEQYKEEMEEKGYSLDVTAVFDDGKLKSIEGSVDFGSSGSGNFCSGKNFSAVILQKKWLGGMSIQVQR